MPIGIDLGTTNSVASYLNAASQFESTEYDGKPIPSLISINYNRLSTYKFGNEKGVEDGLLVRGIKNFLGYENFFQVETLSLNAQDLCAEYLKWLLTRLPRATIDFTQEPIVCSVPVKYGEKYRQRLRDAFRSIGVENLRFIYEPTAAAIRALGHQGAFENPGNFMGNILVLDWGGGTIDISILSLNEDGSVEDINTEAVAQSLGGSDMDEWLLNDAVKGDPFIADQVDLLDRSKKSKLFNKIERIKISMLCGELKTDITLNLSDIIQANDLGKILEITITQDSVNKCVDYFAAQVNHYATQAVKAASLSIEDIKYRIFIGGPFASPKISSHRVFNSWVNAKPLTVPSGVQFATAEGCALLALKGFEAEIACDFGVLQENNSFFPCVRYGMAFPPNNPINNTQNFRFDMKDLSCPEAVFCLGRTAGKREKLTYIPNNTLNVPVYHHMINDQNNRRLVPFKPVLAVELTRDLLLKASAIGRIQDNNNFYSKTESIEIDNIPVKVKLG
jgi:molecular chaperone DnaK (HSP70)